jgi:hypothetical protein
VEDAGRHGPYLPQITELGWRSRKSASRRIEHTVVAASVTSSWRSSVERPRRGFRAAGRLPLAGRRLGGHDHFAGVDPLPALGEAATAYALPRVTQAPYNSERGRRYLDNQWAAGKLPELDKGLLCAILVQQGGVGGLLNMPDGGEAFRRIEAGQGKGPTR